MIDPCMYVPPSLCLCMALSLGLCMVWRPYDRPASAARHVRLTRLLASHTSISGRVVVVVVVVALVRVVSTNGSTSGSSSGSCGSGGGDDGSSR